MFMILSRDQKNKIKELGKFEVKGKIANDSNKLIYSKFSDNSEGMYEG